jgi:hypothetical protein
VELFKAELASDSTMKPRSKGYRLDGISKRHRTWPELWDLRLNEITIQACKDWAAKLNRKIASQYFYNVTRERPSRNTAAADEFNSINFLAFSFASEIFHRFKQSDADEYS